MKIIIGDSLEEIILPSINNKEFNTSSLLGKKILLTFYRFARCPMCNLRINELLKSSKKFGKNFEIIGIFHSEIENLKKAMNRHDVTFNLLADENYKYFSKYDVKTSIWGMLRATIFRFIRTNIAISKGYIPFPIKGYFNIMPVDILIDEKGVVKQVKYAKDIGDHLSIDEIIKFSN